MVGDDIEERLRAIMIYKTGGGVTSATITQYTISNGRPPAVVTSVSLATKRDDWVLARTNTPRYGHKLKAGELLPMNFYSRKGTVGSYSSAYATHGTFPNTPPTPPNTYNSWWVGGAPIWPGGVDYAQPNCSELVGNAFPDIQQYVQSAAANIYSQGWDALTFAGELGHTVAMFRNIGKSLVNLLLRGDLASTWLQYRYGWRILYFDMMALQDAINRIDDGRKRYRERAKAQTTSTRTTNGPNWNWSTSSGSVQRVEQIKISVQGMVVADIEPPRVHLNLVKTGWELVTASFIIDWFINIGQWIDSMSFLAIQSGYTAGIAWKCEIEAEHYIFGVAVKSPHVIDSIDLDCSVVHTEFFRAPSSIPLGLSTIRRLNNLKVLDMILIIKQLLVGKVLPGRI